jgi:hypothetical protein
MKKIQFLLLAALLMVGLGLGGSFEASAQAQEPKRIIFVTYMPGTTDYQHSVVISDLFNRKTGINVAVNPYQVATLLPKALQEKKGDVGMFDYSQLYYFFQGKDSQIMGKMEQSFPEFRILTGAYVLWWEWIVRPDLGAKTISDLKGKRVSYLLPGRIPSNMMGRESLLAVGVDPDKDVKHINFAGTQQMKDGYKAKQVDAILTSMGGASTEEVKAVVGFDPLPWTVEIYNTFNSELKNHAMLKEVPAGWIKYLDKPKQLALGWPKMLACRSELSDETTYTLVKTVMENSQDLLKISPEYKEYGSKEYALPTTFPIPLHAGAIKYYKEVGMWTPAHEAQQQKVSQRK